MDIVVRNIPSAPAIAHALHQHSFYESVATALEEHYDTQDMSGITDENFIRSEISAINSDVEQYVNEDTGIKRKRKEIAEETSSSKKRKISEDSPTLAESDAVKKAHLFFSIMAVLKQLIPKKEGSTPPGSSVSSKVFDSALRPDCCQALRPNYSQALRILRGGMLALHFVFLKTAFAETWHFAKAIQCLLSIFRLWENQQSHESCFVRKNSVRLVCW